MAKFRMKYRAPVEGVKIAVSEATYQRLKAVALANMPLIPSGARTTIDRAIGFWCEDRLRQFRQLEWPVTMPRSRPVPVADSGKERHFQIGEWEFVQIEKYAKEQGKKANQWIAATVLFALGIAEVKARGAREQPDRFG